MNKIKLTMIILPIVLISVNSLSYEVTTQNGKEIFWTLSDLPVTYQANQYGCPDCSGVGEAFTKSGDTWSVVDGSEFRFVRGADTDIVQGNTDDGHNVLVFYEPDFANDYGQGGLPYGDPTYVAVNTFWFKTNTQPHYYELFEFDIIFNGYYYEWDTSENGTEGDFDVENVATHELGHALSLADLYDSSMDEFTMYGYTVASEIKKRTLDNDDKDGICYLYDDGSGTVVRPKTFDIRQNYPNPATTSTTILFTIPTGANGSADVAIYDLKGRLVAQPFSGHVNPGVKKVEWDLINGDGSAVAAGVYLYRVTFLDETRTSKIIVK